MYGVEAFGFCSREPQGFHCYDLKFCGVDAADNVGCEAPTEGVGLHDC
jgi:hypothetical protein